MNKAFQVLFLLLATIGLFGCAADGYWTDRRHDAMDIFSLSVGSGTGVRARVGPIGTGLLLDSTVAGSRGGEWLDKGSFLNKGNPVTWTHDIQLGLVGEEDFMGGLLCLERGKSFSSRMLFGLNIPTRKTFQKEGFALAAALKAPAPSPARYAPVPYLTQVELVVGLGASVRIGFNPGELLDFLLGWAGIDLFNDDIEAGVEMPAEKPAEKQPETRTLPAQPRAAPAPVMQKPATQKPAAPRPSR